jgi:hypothetical protein
MVRASAASPRPPAISPFALSFSLSFFPSLAMATSRERRPWRPEGGCAPPQTPSPACVHPWRRARRLALWLATACRCRSVPLLSLSFSLPLPACRSRPSPSQCGVAAFYGCSALVGRGRGRGGEAMDSCGEAVRDPRGCWWGGDGDGVWWWAWWRQR